MTTVTALHQAPGHTTRKVKNNVATVLVTLAFGLALIPLVWLLWTVISKGIHAMTRNGWFTQSQRGITFRDPGGGAWHAILGTLEQVFLCSLISVPIVADGRHLPRRVRPWTARQGDDVHGRHPQRCAVDRRRAVHLRRVHHDVPRAARRLAGLTCPGVADDPGDRAHHRGDAQARPERVARGVLRAGRAEVEDDPAHRRADRADRHHHRHRARDRPRRRRDRAAADPGRLHPEHQRQPASTASRDRCPA